MEIKQQPEIVELSETELEAVSGGDAASDAAAQMAANEAAQMAAQENQNAQQSEMS